MTERDPADQAVADRHPDIPQDALPGTPTPPLPRLEVCPDCSEIVCDWDCPTAAANGWPTDPQPALFVRPPCEACGTEGPHECSRWARDVDRGQS